MDRLTRLHAVRDRLADAIAECESARDLAGLSKEYRQCLAEIDTLQSDGGEVNRVDEIAQRRATRSAGAETAGSADRSG